ncbi:MAG: MoaD/ThiS family protein [Ferrimicrobium sp.]
MTEVSVRFFGAARSLAGASATRVSVAQELPKVTDILEELVFRFGPEMATLLDYSSIAIEDDIVSIDTVVVAGSEVVILPPVSGGAAGEPWSP